MTTGYSLRLVRDTLAAGARVAALGAAPRVVYVLDGEATVGARDGDVAVTAGDAWHGAGDVVVAAGASGATLLRYELARGGRPPAVGEVRLEHAIDLDPTRAWLMRCDRVEFDPGGVALPHGHKGGGIRCLVAGSLAVTVGDSAPRVMRPGEAWFESGREPVVAQASPSEATAFIRVSVLPREIRGQSSIVYVNPQDAARGRPRRYTVFVDAPIELPA